LSTKFSANCTALTNVDEEKKLENVWKTFHDSQIATMNGQANGQTLQSDKSIIYSYVISKIIDSKRVSKLFAGK
jgi:hypothetical protein